MTRATACDWEGKLKENTDQTQWHHPLLTGGAGGGRGSEDEGEEPQGVNHARTMRWAER